MAWHHQGVVAEVGVEQLFVAEGALGVLRAQHGLVHAKVRVSDTEELLGQIDDAVVHHQVVRARRRRGSVA